MAKQQVLLIGGTGFIGSAIVESLLQSKEFEVHLMTRSSSRRKENSRQELVQTHLYTDVSEASLKQLFAQLDPNVCIINLVGVLHASQAFPYGPEFKVAHIDIVRAIISGMRAHRLQRYIHMSALGADSQGPSMYLRSKGEAELLVKASGLDWTIIRPSVVFGETDNFINMFGKLQRFFPIMPLAGAYVQFQPVSVLDVAEVFKQAILEASTIHQSYDLGGPTVYSLAELIRFAAKRQGISRPVIPLPDWMGYLQALLLEKLPGPTVMSRDNLASMKSPSILDPSLPNAFIETFKISPRPLESLMR